MRKIISVVLSFGLLFQQSGLLYAAGEINLANYLSQAKSAIVQPDVFQPARLRYISYDIANNDFKILLDKGNNVNQKTEKLKNQKTLESLNSLTPKLLNSQTPELNESTQELFNYFLIGLSLPNDTFWVNLRPDAPENIIDPLLEKTDIGKIFLEADLQLKKDASSLTSPQNPEGKAYWDKLYKKAGELFGTENITIPTITRPWIVPNEVIVRETEDSAYIYKATLKVMLEADYLTGRGGSRTAPTPDQYAFSDPRLKELNEYSSQIIRETIIPKLTKEVNSSKRYAQLRQVYYSLVLARWFKQKYSSLGSVRAAEHQSAGGSANNYISLIDSGNLVNLASQQPCDKQSYFQAYQKSFKDGEYNLKETVATPFGQSIRSYISGGIGINADSPIMPGKIIVPNSLLAVNGAIIGNSPEQSVDAVVGSPLLLSQEEKNIASITDLLLKQSSLSEKGIKRILENWGRIGFVNLDARYGHRKIGNKYIGMDFVKFINKGNHPKEFVEKLLPDNKKPDFLAQYCLNITENLYTPWDDFSIVEYVGVSYGWAERIIESFKTVFNKPAYKDTEIGKEFKSADSGQRVKIIKELLRDVHMAGARFFSEEISYADATRKMAALDIVKYAVVFEAYELFVAAGSPLTVKDKKDLLKNKLENMIAVSLEYKKQIKNESNLEETPISNLINALQNIKSSRDLTEWFDKAIEVVSQLILSYDPGVKMMPTDWQKKSKLKLEKGKVLKEYNGALNILIKMKNEEATTASPLVFEKEAEKLDGILGGFVENIKSIPENSDFVNAIREDRDELKGITSITDFNALLERLIAKYEKVYDFYLNRILGDAGGYSGGIMLKLKEFKEALREMKESQLRLIDNVGAGSLSAVTLKSGVNVRLNGWGSETLREVLKDGQPVDFVVCPPQLYRNGVEYGSPEFFVNYNLFRAPAAPDAPINLGWRRGNYTFLVAQNKEQKEAIERIIARSFLGSPREFYEKIRKGEIKIEGISADDISPADIEHFMQNRTKFPAIGDPLEIRQFVKVYVLGEEFDYKARNGSDLKLKIERDNNGRYRITETVNGRNWVYQNIIADEYKQPVTPSIAVSKEQIYEHKFFNRPEFGYTILGDSHGFDPAGNNTSILVSVAGKYLLIDGSPVTYRITKDLEIPSLDIEYVFLTHTHDDHDAILNRVLNGLPVKLIATPAVYANFVAKANDKLKLYGQDIDIGEWVDYIKILPGQRLPIFNGKAVIECPSFYNKHTLPTSAVKIGYVGEGGNIESSIAYTSDTQPDPQLLQFVKDSDVIFYDAGVPPLHPSPAGVANQITDEELRRRVILVHASDEDVKKAGNIGLSKGDLLKSTSFIPADLSARVRDNDNISKCLAAVAYLNSLSPEALQVLVRKTKVRNFSPGSKIIKQGETVQSLQPSADALYLIVSGEAKVNIDGGQIRLKPGMTFGEFSAVNPLRPRSADVSAGDTGLVAISFSKATILALIQDFPEVKEAVERIQYNLLYLEKLSEIEKSPFNQLPIEVLYDLAEKLKPVEFEKGSDVLVEGELSGSEGAYILTEGQLEISSKSGGVLKRIYGNSPDNVFGEGAFFDPEGRRNATVTATTKVKALHIAFADFREALERHPGLKYKFYVLSANRRDENANGHHLQKGDAGSPLTVKQEELIKDMRNILKTLGNNLDKDKIISGLSDKISDSVKSIIAKVTEKKKENVAVDEFINDLTGDSLLTLEIIALLEKNFGVSFNDEEIEKYSRKTVVEITGDLSNRIEGVYNAVMSDKGNEEIFSVMEKTGLAGSDMVLRHLLKQICRIGVDDLLKKVSRSVPRGEINEIKESINEDEIGNAAFKLGQVFLYKEGYKNLDQKDYNSADACNLIWKAWRSVNAGSPLLKQDDVKYLADATTNILKAMGPDFKNKVISQMLAEIPEKVISIVRGKFVKEYDANKMGTKNLYELLGDSLEVIDLFAELEFAFPVDFSEDDMKGIGSVNGAIDYLNRYMKEFYNLLLSDELSKYRYKEELFDLLKQVCKAGIEDLVNKASDQNDTELIRQNIKNDSIYAAASLLKEEFIMAEDFKNAKTCQLIMKAWERAAGSPLTFEEAARKLNGFFKEENLYPRIISSTRDMAAYYAAAYGNLNPEDTDKILEAAKVAAGLLKEMEDPDAKEAKIYEESWIEIVLLYKVMLNKHIESIEKEIKETISAAWVGISAAVVEERIIKLRNSLMRAKSLRSELQLLGYIPVADSLISGVSSAIGAQEAVLVPPKRGGIDLTDRMLNMRIERVGSFASSALVLPEIANVEALDLDKEYERIQAMVSSSIRPSDTRILEFAAACYYRGEFDRRLAQVSSCVKAAHLADELLGKESSPELRLATMLPDALYGG